MNNKALTLVMKQSMTQRHAISIAGQLNLSTDIRKSVHRKQQTTNNSYRPLNSLINTKTCDVTHTQRDGTPFSAVAAHTDKLQPSEGSLSPLKYAQ
jgi:hypothetical protein